MRCLLLLGLDWRVDRMIFVRIVHEVVLVSVLVLDRVPKELIFDDVLLPHGPILLLLHYHFLVHFTCRVIVRNLRLKFDHSGLLGRH